MTNIAFANQKAIHYFNYAILTRSFDLEYLNSYLPNTINEESTKELILNYIKDHHFTSKDFGKLMGLLKRNHDSQIDLNLASSIIKKIFSK